MIDLSPINQLLMQKELAIAVYRMMPMSATDMRMNKGHAMFYWVGFIDGEIQQWRYLRYLGDYRQLLSNKLSLEEFNKVNSVFSANEFRVAVCQQYPMETLGRAKLVAISLYAPSDADYYDVLTGKYWRYGAYGMAEQFIQVTTADKEWKQTTDPALKLPLEMLAISEIKKAIEQTASH